MTIPNQMYIDGAWVDASDGGWIDIVNPANEEVVDATPKATDADLDQALAAADRAWQEWREVDAWTRSAKLRRVAAQGAGAGFLRHEGFHYTARALRHSDARSSLIRSATTG